jgi:hypothetical protein
LEVKFGDFYLKQIGTLNMMQNSIIQGSNPEMQEKGKTTLEK